MKNIYLYCSQAFGVYVLLTELPNYMKNILGLDLKTKAFLAGLPYLVMWLVSGLGSILVDLVIERRVMSRTGARKVANTLAMLVPSFALIGIFLLRSSIRDRAFIRENAVKIPSQKHTFGKMDL